MNDDGDNKDNAKNLNGKSNVIPLKVPRKKKEPNKTSSIWGRNKKDESYISSQDVNTNSEPLINLPLYTKYLLGLIIGVHLIVTLILNTEQSNWALLNLGFIPGRFTGTAIFEPLTLLTPFSHMLLHGGWLHIAMNSIMLLAFGAGIEKWIGGPKMITFFVLCGLFGLAAHMALNFHSIQPVIGASGGLSGLFAAAIVMLNRQNGGIFSRSKYGFWPIILFWVGISIMFGIMGSPDGGDIAWAAHVGGFLGGFVVLKLMKI